MFFKSPSVRYFFMAAQQTNTGIKEAAEPSWSARGFHKGHQVGMAITSYWKADM